MPDLTTEIFLWCEQNAGWSTEVSGSAKEPYVVRYTMFDGYTCTCPAHLYKKGRPECKHIKLVKDERCTHGEEALCGSPSHDWTEDKKCPACGSNAVPIKVAV